MAGSVSAVCVCQPIYSARASLPQVCCRAEQGCLHESGSGAMHGCVCLQCMSLSVYVSVHGMSVSVCVSVCLALPRCDSRKNRPGCSRAAGLAGLCLLCMLTLCAAWQGLRASCQAAYSKRLAQAEGIGAVLLLMLLCCALCCSVCTALPRCLSGCALPNYSLRLPIRLPISSGCPLRLWLPTQAAHSATRRQGSFLLKLGKKSWKAASV